MIIYIFKTCTYEILKMYVYVLNALFWGSPYCQIRNFHFIPYGNTLSWRKETLNFSTMLIITSGQFYDWNIESMARYCPANIYLIKVNNRNTRKRCEIFSKLTIKTPEWRRCRRSGVFIVNFENISQLFPVFLLLTLSK